MEIENKLDEDFLFYLEFANNFLNTLNNKDDIELCRAWLFKLCGEQYIDLESKRNRNIYLSNLVLSMQEGKLADTFLKAPNETDISDAMRVFGHLPSNINELPWLQELTDVPEEEGERDGRIYLATKTLPNGEGAFAYLAVTLAEDEPKWIGGGQEIFQDVLQEKYKEYVPPVTEVERLLLRRKNPAERLKVLTFYDTLLQNINKELEEELTAEQNTDVTELLQQLIEVLNKKGQFDKLREMDEKRQRLELLLILHDRVFARRQKISQKEDLLDDIENKILPQSFFNISVQQEDKFELPAEIWKQAINKMPNKKNMDILFENYPNLLIEKFLDLLANEKEDIAIRMQRRHENIASQMRKDLRKEGQKGQVKIKDLEECMKQATPVLNAIKEAYNKQKEVLNQKVDKNKIVATEHTELYEQMRAALYDTEKSVKEEAERGQLIAEHINSVNIQTEMFQKINENTIKNTEEANIAIMKNIKRLRAAVKQHEHRIQQIREMAENINKSKASSRTLFIV